MLFFVNKKRFSPAAYTVCEFVHDFRTNFVCMEINLILNWIEIELNWTSYTFVLTFLKETVPGEEIHWCQQRVPCNIKQDLNFISTDIFISHTKGPVRGQQTLPKWKKKLSGHWMTRPSWQEMPPDNSPITLGYQSPAKHDTAAPSCLKDSTTINAMRTRARAPRRRGGSPLTNEPSSQRSEMGNWIPSKS